MKLHAWLAAVALVSGTTLLPAATQAADQPAAAAADVPAADTPAPADPLPVIGSGPNGTFSYTMGFTLGQRVSADVKDVDIGAFNDGFRDAYTGAKGKLTDTQMQKVIENFQQQRMAQLKAEHDKLAADNLAKANEFLAKNGKRKGVKTTKSGLQYEVLKKGAGPSPVPTDMVTAHYHGTLADGKVFDSSREGDPVEFPLNRVIPGWTEGVQLMNKGAKYKFFIPPQLG